MHTFNIKTTLNINPTMPSTSHELIYLTRGSSATLNFDFGKEVYDFANTDQLTFIFKQGKTLHWFKMFNYLVASQDEEPIEGKIYYTDVIPIEEDSLQCTATRVYAPEAPLANGYFEEVDNNCSWRDTFYIVDPHFALNSGDGWEYVTLILRPEETKAFKATTPGTEMAFEVALRLNTDLFENLGNTDSIIIEPQHPVAVIDSLYSELV